MKTKELGKTALRVPVMCFGAGALGNMKAVYGYEVDEERALETIRTVFSSTVQYLDTASCYGRSEELIGKVIAEQGGLPEGFLISTKVDPSDNGDYSGKQVRSSVMRSLDRLSLDKLDLLFFHDPEKIDFDASIAPDGPVAELLALKKEGVVKHLGVAGGPVDLLIRYVQTGIFEAVITHNRYTLLERSALPLIEECNATGTALINAAPFGGGILAKGPAVSHNYAYRTAPDEIIDRAWKLHRLCDKYNVPLPAAALQFSLRDPGITSTLVGITRPERIAENIALAEFPIPFELWNEIAPMLEDKPVWLEKSGPEE